MNIRNLSQSDETRGIEGNCILLKIVNLWPKYVEKFILSAWEKKRNVDDAIWSANEKKKDNNKHMHFIAKYNN